MLDWGTPFCMFCGNAFWDGIALLLNTVGGCCTGLAELVYVCPLGTGGMYG